LLLPLIGLVGFFKIDWKPEKDNARIPARGVFSGLLLAVPVLAIFGGLLGEADPKFRQALSFASSFDGTDLIPRIFMMGIMAVGTLGFWITLCPPFYETTKDAVFPPHPQAPIVYHRGVIYHVEGPMPPRQSPLVSATNRTHAVTAATFLGSIAALFTLFLVFQVRYLFGGDAIIQNTANLGYGEYAREGFMQIFTVTCLTLPILLMTQSAVSQVAANDRKPVGITASVLACLLLPLLASSTHRLILYTNAYGLSTLRFYTGAGILWLGVAIGAYLYFAPRWKLTSVATSAYVALSLITMLCNVIRPDSVIAKVNLTRQTKQTLDVDLIRYLGADARPAIEKYGSKKLVEDFDATTSRSGAEHDHDASRSWATKSFSEILNASQ
jgi:hypothetical protein